MTKVLRVAFLSLIGGALLVNSASAQGWYLMAPPLAKEQQLVAVAEGRKGKDDSGSVTPIIRVGHGCEFRDGRWL